MNISNKNDSLIDYIKIDCLKNMIEYHKEVRKKRRYEFEEWDKNSLALIKQYEEEISKIKNSTTI